MCYGASREAHGEGAPTTGESGVGKLEIVAESTKRGYCSTVDDVAETRCMDVCMSTGLLLNNTCYPTESCGTGTTNVCCSPGTGLAKDMEKTNTATSSELREVGKVHDRSGTDNEHIKTSDAKALATMAFANFGRNSVATTEIVVTNNR